MEEWYTDVGGVVHRRRGGSGVVFGEVGTDMNDQSPRNPESRVGRRPVTRDHETTVETAANLNGRK